MLILVPNVVGLNNDRMELILVPNVVELNNDRMELILVPDDVELNNDRMELILVPNDVELNNDRMELILVPNAVEFPLVFKKYINQVKEDVVFSLFYPQTDFYDLQTPEFNLHEGIFDSVSFNSGIHAYLSQGFNSHA